MTHVFRAAAIKQLDEATQRAGLPLEWVMDAAGRETTRVILEREPNLRSALIVCSNQTAHRTLRRGHRAQGRTDAGRVPWSAHVCQYNQQYGHGSGWDGRRAERGDRGADRARAERVGCLEARRVLARCGR